jgi:uncharacterized membrane protein YkvA (DUF1232 family)
MLTRMRLAWRLYRDPRVAPRMKVVMPLVALLYVVSPVDLVPDFLLGAGQVDDVFVIAMVMMMLGRLARWAPAGVVEEHLAGLRRRSWSQAGQASAREDVIDVPFRVIESE